MNKIFNFSILKINFHVMNKIFNFSILKINFHFLILTIVT